MQLATAIAPMGDGGDSEERRWVLPSRVGREGCCSRWERQTLVWGNWSLVF